MHLRKFLLPAFAACISAFVVGCSSNKPKAIARAQGPIQWPDGKVLEERVELNAGGRPEALFTVYRDSAGNFIRHGYARHYYTNGQLKFEERFKHGKLDSLTDFWYESGAKQGELPFLGGKPHGMALTWHHNGMKKSEKPWVEGKLHGLAREWDKKGKLVGEVWWENNLQVKAHGAATPADSLKAPPATPKDSASAPVPLPAPANP